ncbi:MAG: nicotinamide mononucleotide transporter [Candidatus Andersenbacteria bacterium]
MIQINWLGEALDTFFSLSGKWGRWLNVRKNKYCFIVWIGCCCYWFCRDVQLGLYSQALFCIPSIFLHGYGFWHWGRDKKSAQKMFTQEEVDMLMKKERLKKKWLKI